MWKKFLNAIRYPRQVVDSVRRGFGLSGGSYVHEESAMSVSAYHRGVMYICTQIAKLPWQIKDKNNEIVEDKISLLLNLRPNREMNAMFFRICMIYNAINHGNSFAEIERNLMGQPVALWPIPSQNVELYRTPEGVLVYRVIAGSSRIPGDDAYLPFDDVFHVKNFHTKDGLVGQGLIAYATETLGISIGANKMAGNLFSNGGLPSGVLEVEGKLSPEAAKRIKESWDQSHTGKKTGGTAVLEEGAKYKAMSMSPDILQFLESRKFGVVEIARFLGLPPTKLFDTDAATFNNMENANLEVATDTLDAWARNLEIEADTKILNNQYGGKYSELDLYQVFRGDMTTRSNYFSKMMQTGAITPNQIREREGLAGYKGGNRYYIATNNYSPADRVDEIVDAQIKKSEPQPPTGNNNSQNDAALNQATIDFLGGNRK